MCMVNSHRLSSVEFYEIKLHSVYCNSRQLKAKKTKKKCNKSSQRTWKYILAKKSFADMCTYCAGPLHCNNALHQLHWNNCTVTIKCNNTCQSTTRPLRRAIAMLFSFQVKIIQSHLIFVTTITTAGCVTNSVKCKIFRWVHEETAYNFTQML